MSYSILPTHRFEKELKRLVKKYPSLKNEFAKLIQDILENPEKGTSLGNNCFKIRIAIDSKGKGKSGGARVISYLYVASETVYLLTIYDKSEKQDITSGELKDIIGRLEFD
jgi:mRNA-degrading endonuclease RelE of RelBE toxin-antitoxin system